MNASVFVLALASYVLATCSCSSTATIHKRDGSIIEARIKRGDATSIYITGCHTVSRFNQDGRPTKVELHCDDDAAPEAIQTFAYDESGWLKKVEMDICADGKVDRLLRYVTDKRYGRRVRRGNPKAAAKMSISTLEKSRCYPQPRFGEFEEVGIPRSQIEDIDHPGDIHAIVTSPLAAWGLTMIVWRFACLGMCNASDECRPDEGLTYQRLTLGFLLALTTGPIAIWGWYTWLHSRSAAAPPDWVQAGPQVFSDGERSYYGLAVRWSW